MEGRRNTQKTRGAWEIRVKQDNAGQSAYTGCSPTCCRAISYPDNQENTADGKED